MDYSDLLERAKTVGCTLEHTHEWTYGEGCECGCKYMLVKRIEILAHCKTLKQAERAITHMQHDLEPYVTQHAADLAATWKAAQMRLF